MLTQLAITRTSDSETGASDRTSPPSAAGVELQGGTRSQAASRKPGDRMIA
jgi:hypothetical protein